MDFKEKLKQDALQVLKIAFAGQSGPNVLGYALNSDLARVQYILYKTHTEAALAALSSQLETEFAAQSHMYNEKLQEVSKIILFYKGGPNAKGWIDRDAWLIWQFGPDEALAECINFRVYFNVRPEKIVDFVKEFISKIFRYSGYCPKCGNKSAKLDYNTQQIVCSICKNNQFDFYFKVHKPVSGAQIMGLLRTDKVVAYAPNKQVLAWLLSVVRQMNAGYFMRPTPFYTHEILPGVGYSVQPSAAQKERFYRDLGDERIMFSWGSVVALVLSQSLVAAVNEQKKRMQTLLNFLVTNPELLAPEQLSGHLLNSIKSVIASAVEKFINDQQLTNICKEIEALEAAHALAK